MSWQSQIYQDLLEGNYQQVAHFYEQAIETLPEELSNYWYLGLAYLLQEKEEEAQTTWLFTLSQGTETEIQQWTRDLIDILEAEAARQQQNKSLKMSWLIRGHIREIDPNLVENLLNLILLEIQLNSYKPALLEDYQIIELLQESPLGAIDGNLLLTVVVQCLSFPSPEVLTLAKASLPHIADPEEFVRKIRATAHQIGYEYIKPSFAAELIELCLKFKPHNLMLLKDLLYFYKNSQNYDKALEIAVKISDYAANLPLKVFASYQILSLHLLTGSWLIIESMVEEYKVLLKEMIENNSQSIERLIIDSFIMFASPLLYLQDNLSENRWYHNKIAQLFQRDRENQIPKLEAQQLATTSKEQKHRLKIGYIGRTLRRHSIGWLSRWLIHYHNREDFQIFVYLVSQAEDDITAQWFRQKSDCTRRLESDPLAIAKQIQQDNIDILVDLESTTFNIIAEVMALKPAPIQVSWLGFDASGIPAIDYFIADPYVLPSDAQDHYQEKIWRLPNTYVAVDGFEVAVPTLKREQLDIPSSSVIYLSGQGGLKRHPNTIKLQIEIIKSVPDSYLLIKGYGNQANIQQLFISYAQQQGVAPERLRFLSEEPTEEIHRANLLIADVVLDTYPYNGATTTLEVLWMGIPLVTRVGEQFAARNSYTFMINAGVEEGIAWSDSEYVEWGIKLGTDEQLRQKIVGKLHQAQKTAPLWNAHQFTREMEKAYQQMWNSL